MAFRYTSTAKGAEILAFAGVLVGRLTPEAVSLLVSLLDEDPDALYDALCAQVLASSDARLAGLRGALQDTDTP